MGKKFLIVYSHPEPKSYTNSAKDVIVKNLQKAGHEVKISDLYAMKFNPVASPNEFKERADKEHFKLVMEQRNANEKGTLDPMVKSELDKLLWCDYLIVVCPYWWGNVPAMVKGWFDRVLVCGATWDFGKYWKDGPLAGKTAWLVTSVFGPDQIYSKEGMHGMKMDDRLHAVTWGTFAFCGMNVLPTYVSYNVAMGSDEERKACLARLEKEVQNIDNSKLLYSF